MLFRSAADGAGAPGRPVLAGRSPWALCRLWAAWARRREADRKSVVEGKSVDLGGRRIIKKKTQQNIIEAWAGRKQHNLAK